MSNAWSGYIIALVALNVAGAVWLLWWTAKRRGAKEADTTGHVWDENLTEYNKPLPRWWLWLFVLTVVFAGAYLALYPGLGNVRGGLQWTQTAQHQAEVAAAERAYNARLAKFSGMDVPALSRNVEAMAAARNLFAHNCSTCHGSDARGARGFPNLTDQDWLYGGDPDSLLQTIGHGRQGVMPPMAQILGASGVEDVIAYVLSLSQSGLPAEMVSAGKPRFEMLCASCHGVNGHGSALVGAPNLTDRTWLYGNDPRAIREALTQGRNNQMPAHLPLLGEQKVRLLAAYVYNLSHPGQTAGSAGTADAIRAP
jgi:cytochrome c oxidase cbb3-type subunit 3